MRRSLLTSGLALLAGALIATGTAGAANKIGLAQVQNQSHGAGDGSVSSHTQQGNGAWVEQDNRNNYALVGQRNISRKLQIGNDTSSTTEQANVAGVSQSASRDNWSRVTQKNSAKTIQRPCLIRGGPDLSLGVGVPVGAGVGVSLPGRDVAVVQQINPHLGVQRSC